MAANPVTPERPRSGLLVDALKLSTLILVIAIAASVVMARRTPPTPHATDMVMPVPATTLAGIGRTSPALAADDVREAPSEDLAETSDTSTPGTATTTAQDEAPAASGAGGNLPNPLWTRKADGPAAPPAGSPLAPAASAEASPPAWPAGVMVSRPFAVATEETTPEPPPATSEPEASIREPIRDAAPSAQPQASGAPATAQPSRAPQPPVQTAATTPRPLEPAKASPEPGQAATASRPAAELLREAVQAYQAGEYQKAYTLWRPLAGRGIVRAQYHLGALYYEGRLGVPDRVEAYIWLDRSASGGYPAAESLRDKVLSEMSPAERDQLRQRATPRS